MTTKHTFKEGDRVRIARQPKNQWVSLVGEVGIIEEIQDDHCMVRTYSMDGGCGGSGTIPLSCLEPFQSKALEVQIAEYQASLDKLTAEAEARKSAWNTFVEETALKYSSIGKTKVERLLLLGRQWRGPGD